MNRHWVWGTALSLVLLASGSALCDDAETTEESSASSLNGDPSPQIEAVDIPTAEIYDPMTYAATFRFYNDGGVTSRLIIGPLKRVNLGISFDAQRVVGAGDPHMIVPSVFFKLRAFDGTDYLPALAIGYDNQGFLYQESTKEFLHREKGLYFVGSHAILLPSLEFHGGVNIYDFDTSDPVYGFIGMTFKITQSFALLADYDNLHNLKDARFNMGGRWWIAPYFNVDFAARHIGYGEDKGAERILRLNYVGRFPI